MEFSSLIYNVNKDNHKKSKNNKSQFYKIYVNKISTIYIFNYFII